MAIIYQPRGRAREYSEWAANLYSGCSHGCQYCFAPAVCRKAVNDFHHEGVPRKNVLRELERDCQQMANRIKSKILLSFTSDPYQPEEVHYGITRQAIKIIHSYGLSVQILTKGGTRAEKDFGLLNSNDAFATTLTFLDNNDSAYWEPNAAKPIDRIKAIKKAHSLGIPTWVSLEPVIEPDQTLEIIQETSDYVDLYKVGKLNHHPLASKIDWNLFVNEAVELLCGLGKDYYIKKDLAVYLSKDLAEV